MHLDGNIGAKLTGLFGTLLQDSVKSSVDKMLQGMHGCQQQVFSVEQNINKLADVLSTFESKIQGTLISLDKNVHHLVGKVELAQEAWSSLGREVPAMRQDAANSNTKVAHLCKTIMNISLELAGLRALTVDVKKHVHVIASNVSSLDQHAAAHEESIHSLEDSLRNVHHTLHDSLTQSTVQHVAAGKQKHGGSRCSLRAGCEGHVCVSHAPCSLSSKSVAIFSRAKLQHAMAGGRATPEYEGQRVQHVQDASPGNNRQQPPPNLPDESVVRTQGLQEYGKHS
jgi:predicted  nucleic acid-binding Zn-ribbon protein